MRIFLIPLLLAVLLIVALLMRAVPPHVGDAAPAAANTRTSQEALIVKSDEKSVPTSPSRWRCW